MLPERIEFVPRIRTEIPAPGSPDDSEICTPAVLPWISCSGDWITPCWKSSDVTDDTDPVASFTVVVP